MLLENPYVSKIDYLAIICILRCLALVRPLVSLCLAAMHRIWSSNVKVADSSGTGATYIVKVTAYIISWSLEFCHDKQA